MHRAGRELLGGAGVAAALPLRGFAPFRPQQGAFGFNVSHWSGPLAQLTVSQNFTYDATWTGLFGQHDLRRRAGLRLQDAGLNKKAATATRATSTSTPTTPSTAPAGSHDAAKVLHLAQRGLLLQLRAADAASRLSATETRGPAPGDLERVTVMGPGVTPDVQWVGPGLGKYDAGQDATYNALFDQLSGPTTRSAPPSANCGPS